MRHVRRRPIVVLLAAALVGALTTTGVAVAAGGKGRLVLKYDKPKNADIRTLQNLVRDDAAFGDLVKGLDAAFKLPRVVTVRVGGSDGPYYDPDRREIVMSPDFTAWAIELFSKDYKGQELRDKVALVTDWAFLHELGHAFVDQWDLPITGKEEDAVDDLADVISTELMDLDDLALAAAELWGYSSDERETFYESDFWDEHSLDEQRFYSLICDIYGSNPKKYRTLPKEAGIPASQMSSCQQDYKRKVKSWMTLIKPHVKA